MTPVTFLLALVVTAVAGATPAIAQSQSGPAERPAGSGVIVHPDGYVLTAHHVISNARRIVVVTSGEFRAPAILVSADPDHDLALVKIDTVGLSEAPLGYAGMVKLDDEVIVAGFPFGLRDVSVSRGRISAIRTKGVQRVFQVDAAVNPGNSGGAVFNQQGEVIGILTTKFTHPSGITPEGMAFAVPISYATPLVANVPDFDFAAIGKNTRKPRRRDAKKLVRELARATVRIETVRLPEASPGSPAEPAGYRPKAERPAPIRKSQPVQDRHDEQGGTARGDTNTATFAQVNAQLAAAQRDDLNRLAQQGIHPPDGMVLIPAGEFLMGDDDGPPDARPMHRVFLSAYWIDKYEVTNEQYRQCVSRGVCSLPKHRQAFDNPERAQYPVTNVTWAQARAYCQWRDRRLPTEAEWEKAARGTDGRRYPWGNSDEVIARRRAQLSLAAGNGIAPVGSLPEDVSPYGVFDMVGNVWEWVKDWYAENYYEVSPPQDPQGPPHGSFRVLRGGDWSQSAQELWPSYRGWDEMTYWGPTLGFRCAADLP